MALHNITNKGFQDEDPTPKDCGFMIVLVLVAIITIILTFAGCRTAKTPEQKQYEATTKQLADLQALRTRFPCDTATVTKEVHDTAIIFTVDTTFVFVDQTDRSGGKGIMTITKYKTINHTVDRVVKVIDMAALQSARDSAEQSMYLFAQCTKEVAPVVKENTDLKAKLSAANKFKTWVLSLFGLAVIGAIVLIVKKVI